MNAIGYLYIQNRYDTDIDTLIMRKFLALIKTDEGHTLKV